MFFQKGKKHAIDNNEYSFSRGFEELSSQYGFSQMSHAYRENFRFPDRQMMSHVLNAPWLFAHKDSYLERRFSLDRDRNSIPNTYGRYQLHRKRENNGLRPTAFDEAFQNMQKEDGSFDFDRSRRALTYTAQEKEQMALKSLFQPLENLKEEKKEEPDLLSHVVDNAAHAFQRETTGYLKEGTLDTVFSESGVPSYDPKAALHKKGQEESIESYGYAIAGMKKENKKKKEDVQPTFLNPMRQFETQNLEERSRERQREQEKQEDKERLDALIQARQRLSAYTSLRASISLGLDRDSRRRLNDYHNIQGNQREAYHSQLDPREEFSSWRYDSLLALAKGAKHVNASYINESVASPVLEEEKEWNDALKSSLELGALFTDRKKAETETTAEPISYRQFPVSSAVSRRIRKTEKALDEYEKYVPEQKRFILQRLRQRGEWKEALRKDYLADENALGYSGYDMNFKLEEILQDNEDSGKIDVNDNSQQNDGFI